MTGGAPEPLTLELAWELATAHNKDVQMQRQQVELSTELVKDRQNERLPRVAASGRYAYLGGLVAYETNAWLQNPEAVAVPASPHAVRVGLEADWEMYTGGRLKNPARCFCCSSSTMCASGGGYPSRSWSGRAGCC